MESNEFNKYFENCIKIYNQSLNDYKMNKITFLVLKGKIEKIIEILSKLKVKTNNTDNLNKIRELLKNCKLKLFEMKFETLNKISEYKPLNENLSIEGYINSRVISNEYLINFKDIFLIPTNNVKDRFIKNFKIINYKQNKNLLLYGPKGCGKTLVSQCFAGIENNINYIMINNINYFSVQGFISSFIKIIPYKQPIVIFFKNINLMTPILNRLNSIIDILNSKKDNKIYIIASCNHPNEIPKDLLDKFKIEFIPPIFNLNDKINYIKYLSELTGIPLYLNEDDYMNVVIKLRNFSNEDMKNLIIYCNSITSQITKEVLINNINNIKFTLTDDVLKIYNLH